MESICSHALPTLCAPTDDSTVTVSVSEEEGGAGSSQGESDLGAVYAQLQAIRDAYQGIIDRTLSPQDTEVCVCVCVCARARVCVCVCVCV